MWERLLLIGITFLFSFILFVSLALWLRDAPTEAPASPPPETASRPATEPDAAANEGAPDEEAGDFSEDEEERIKELVEEMLDTADDDAEPAARSLGEALPPPAPPPGAPMAAEAPAPADDGEADAAADAASDDGADITADIAYGDLDLVPVHYATNRVLVEESRGGLQLYMDQDSGSIAYGVADVTLPPGHQCARLEGRKLTWRNLRRGEFSFNPATDVFMHGFTPTTENGFFSRLKFDTAAQGDQTHILVYVHGFASSFENAARRTAQLNYDLTHCFGAPELAPVMFSWPTTSSPLPLVKFKDYSRDQANADASIGRLADFLVDIKNRTDADKIHIIAHSMGNRVLAPALDLARRQLPETDEPLFGHIAFVAADIDKRVFVDIAEQIDGVSEQATLYASTTDTAMVTARRLRGDLARAGDARPPVTLAPGVITVDASGADTKDGAGHALHGDNSPVLRDMALIIAHGYSPDQRGLAQSSDAQYWVLAP